MKKLFNDWKKLTIWHKAVCLLLLFWIARGVYLEKYEAVIFGGAILLIYWSRETMDPAERKKMMQARFRSSFSDPLDPGNPTGFNNPASPLSHMHNSPSISSSFDQYRG